MHRRALPHGRRARLTLAAVAVAAVPGAMLAATALSGPAAHLGYARDVQPIFDRSCTACHPASFPSLDLRRGRSWRQLVRVLSATNPAYELVLPGRPELSYLLVHPPDPSNARLLSAADRRVIASWISDGAADD